MIQNNFINLLQIIGKDLNYFQPVLLNQNQFLKKCKLYSIKVVI